MKEINILLVDDHKLIREGIRSIIDTSYNIHVVEECDNGKEALHFLEKNHSDIDLVLMDIGMPVLNGIDATNTITKNYPEIRVLALTMHAEEAYIVKMIKAGALGYILKDSSREKLIEAIKTVYRKEKYYSNEVSLKLINLLMDDDDIKEDQKLSKREIEVLKSITNGNTSREIAKQLSISDRTAESHRRNIIKKLNVKNTAELVSYALSNGIV